ncbi:hypothetical protein [Xanthomonas phage X1]|nr:hypothetical protein [Xanthomonas phage X1]
MPLSFFPDAVPTAIGWAHPLTGEQLTAGAIPASQLDGDTPVDFYKPNAKAKSFLDPAGSTRNLINHVAHGKRVEFAVHSLDKIASVAWTFGGAAVASVNVTAGGSGYTGAPTVTFAAPPAGGVRATGTAVLTGAAVTGVTITNPGSGYTAAPAITFAGGAGTGAAATAVLAANAAVAGGAVQQKVFPAGTHSVKAVVSYVGGTPANVTLNTSVTVA